MWRDIKNVNIMEAIALEYKPIETVPRVFRRKTGLEEAFEDIENGRVTRIYTPKNWKSGNS